MEQKSLGNDMSLTLKLQNPLTEEQLDSLLDVDFDHTNEVYFRTKHGKEVTFVKKQPNNGWISVKDRLPEKNGDYLIYNTDGIVWPYWYDKEYKEWYDSSGYLTESVTHWMPMPEPPET